MSSQWSSLEHLAAAAKAFLGGLAPRTGDASFAFTDDERFDWHYTPRRREGMKIGDMIQRQRNDASRLVHLVHLSTSLDKTRNATLVPLLRGDQKREHASLLVYLVHFGTGFDETRNAFIVPFVRGRKKREHAVGRMYSIHLGTSFDNERNAPFMPLMRGR